MASHLKDNDIGLAPADTPPAADYERDFYSWLMEQAAHVRAGHWDALDRENLAEEIESLGREQFNKLESALRVLMTQMLKWDHQRARRSRSWSLSISAQRLELDDVLSDNPGLRPRIDEAITRAYRKARVEAAKETELDTEAFPDTCPYTWDDIESREFSR
jgi:predicted DNA-binding ribbon-helix-helix protein